MKGAVRVLANFLKIKPYIIFGTLLLSLFAKNVYAIKYVSNFATAEYSVGVINKTSTSNTVTHQVCSQAKIKLLKYTENSNNAESIKVSKTYFIDNSGEHELPNPIPLGSVTPLDLNQPLNLISSEIFHGGEPIFIKVEDDDQNADLTKQDSIIVNLKTIDPKTGAIIDEEDIKFFETGDNTGIFAGYIQSSFAVAVKNNGILNVVQESKIIATYSDKCGPTDTSTNVRKVESESLIDPYGKVFDSTNGKLINGAKITLVDVNTGLPATVYGDDGVSIFPSTITSGGTVTDSGGTVYNFPTGEYRFPLIPAGTYKLVVVPPNNYKFPSNATISQINALPNGPYTIVAGSKGENFIVPVSSLPIKIDLPLDPKFIPGLFITKEANKDVVSIGDFLQYKITVENPNDFLVANVRITDVLPLGFRYKNGSTKINNIKVSDPVISNDGRTLLFSTGDIPAKTKITITYVVEVSAGANLGPAKNIAMAKGDGGVSSNIAKAEVIVKEDFFSNKSFIIGKVMIGCEKKSEKLEKITEKVEEEVIVEKKGEVSSYLLSTIRKEGSTHDLFYEIPIEVGSIGVKDVRVLVRYSEGLVYRSGTGRVGDRGIEPEVKEGEMTYRLGDMGSGERRVLSFRMGVDGVVKGDIILRAEVIFDTEVERGLKIEGFETVYRVDRNMEAITIPMVIRPHFESGSAVLTEEDRRKLEDVVIQLSGYRIKSIEAIGHTDNQRIGRQLKSVYSDNYDLSKARAESVLGYLMRHLDLRDASVRAVGKGEDEPLVPNDSPYNMYLNRRVELNIVAERIKQELSLIPIKDKIGPKAKEFTKIAVEKSEEIKEKKALVPETKPRKRMEFVINTADDLTNEWLNTQFSGFEIILPKDGYYPSIPSLQVALKHNPANKVKLFVNGKEVENIFLDSTRKSIDNTVAVTLWIGVSIKEGDNIIEAVEYDLIGREVGRTKKIIHYSGPPVKVELVPEKSKLIADGKTPPIIAVRLTDKDGHPAREGVVGEYKVMPPYLPLKDVLDLQKDPLSKSSNVMSKYLIKENGIAYIELNPTSQTGEVVLKFNLMNEEKELRVWLKPEKRDWILVGLLEGTLGSNLKGGNKQNFTLSGLNEGFNGDGRIAFFAKGMLDDNWVLTVSYDSDRTDYKGYNRKLFGMIDPSKYYTLYGDTTSQQYDAPSSRQFYLKLERDRFYAMYGDFQTNLTSTELSKYVRSLTGVKSELKTDKYEFNLFIADTNQLFVKDELMGNGTSGLYKLSNKNIVINSEKITIETRDRFRSEIVISSKSLTRFIDYNIDYDSGTIFFKSPISNFDENLNPIYIVVEYEVFNTGKSVYNYGGRGAIRLFDKKIEIGGTYIHEDAGIKDGDLLGLDVKVNITDKTTLKTEIAKTNTNNTGTELSGTAYLVELSHNSEKLKGRIYFRELDKDFGLGQQNASETGTRKMGMSLTYSLIQNLDISTELMRQYNLTDDNRRDMAEVKANYRDKKYDFFAGIRHAEDTMKNGDKFTSEQVFTGLAVRLLEDKLTLKVQRDQSIKENENVDFPTRTMFGADYKLNDKITFFAVQEMLDGKSSETDTTKLGMKASPWKGGQINSTIEQQYTENGVRVFSVMGLQQAWQVNDKWSLSAGLDRSDTIKNAKYTFNNRAYSASNNEDFTAINFGAGYKEKMWAWNGRFEYRDGQTEDKYGLFSSIYGEVKDGIGLGSSIQFFDTNSKTAEQIFADLRLGLVYRPKISKYTLLERMDIILDKNSSLDNNYNSFRVVNNLNLNFKDGKKLQFSFQYGAKFVKERIDENDYSGYTDLIGFEGRYDITKNWDLGFRFKLLHSWSVEQYKYSFGPSVGFTPEKNIWLSLGYNFIGFTDRDFSKADYTTQGVYLNFKIKFDQESAKNSIKWLIGSP